MTDRSRQTDKTRSAIQSAFAELVFAGRFDEIEMADIAELANVDRPTLDQHYNDKDAILLDNMAPLLRDLASVIAGDVAAPQIEKALTQIWAHRDRGRVIFFATTGQKLEKALSGLISDILSTTEDSPELALSLPFISNQIAASVFSILRTWLRGDASDSVPDIARHICRSSALLLAGPA